MSEAIATLLTLALLDNMVLDRLQGVSLLRESGGHPAMAAWLALATGIALLLAAFLGWLLQLFSIAGPDGLILLWLMTLLALLLPPIGRRLGARMAAVMPLALANSGLLGLVLSNVHENAGLLMGLWRALGYGLGFAFVIIIFACLPDRIDNNRLPVPMRGLPVQLLILGIMSMAIDILA